MAILDKKGFNELVKKLVGEDTSDDALKAIEDLTDTYDNLSKKDDTDWKAKYEENDAKWRQTYKDRFFASQDEGEPAPVPAPDKSTDITKLTYENLFKQEE